MSKTIFFKEYTIYKPDFNQMNEEIIVDKLIKCKDKCFHSFEFDCICDVQFKGIKNKKTINKKIEMLD